MISFGATATLGFVLACIWNLPLASPSQKEADSNNDFKFSAGGARLRFEEKFQSTCQKYPFVTKFAEMMRQPFASDDKYLIFVFHDASSRSSVGGLGDRIAGMITAIAYAIRTNRRFIIQGEGAFEEAFRPYSADKSNPDEVYTYKSWDWTGWNRAFAANMTKLNCVNPRPGHQHCGLDSTTAHDAYKVIKLSTNRCYLCRWVVKPSLGLAEKLRTLFGIEGITADTASGPTDLYQVAGCLLRLAMWPTEKLWVSLDESLSNQFRSAGYASASTSKQIGLHFRCGDSSFTENKINAPPNPECYVDKTIEWKGTNFMDDRAMDSPVDEGQCAKMLITNLTSTSTLTHTESSMHGNGVLAYIASDNPVSSDQMNSTLEWGYTIRPPKACHVDSDHGKGHHCTLSTSLQWFMLSLSDVIVTQALIKPTYSMYNPSQESAALEATRPYQQAPISAFSRYAAIYSLGAKGILYGRSCTGPDTRFLGLQSHGNWACDPAVFY